MEKLANCIRFIKSSDGGFKTFGDFMAGLFAEFPTDQSSGTDAAYQTATQTVRTFLKWNPLKGILDKISSHHLMVKDENTKGIVPSYCISPGISTSDGMISLLV